MVSCEVRSIEIGKRQNGKKENQASGGERPVAVTAK